MTNLDRVLTHGIYDDHDGEISTEGDFKIKFTTLRQVRPISRHDYKEYIADIKITYNDTVLVSNIINFERFIASLKIFIDKRNLFKGKDIYFEEKVKDGISSLQLMKDPNRYISLMEATQMTMLIFGALSGYSRKLLYLNAFKKHSCDYVSTERQRMYDRTNSTKPERIDWSC